MRSIASPPIKGSSHRSTVLQSERRTRVRRRAKDRKRADPFPVRSRRIEPREDDLILDRAAAADADIARFGHASRVNCRLNVGNSFWSRRRSRVSTEDTSPSVEGAVITYDTAPDPIEARATPTRSEPSARDQTCLSNWGPIEPPLCSRNRKIGTNSPFGLIWRRWLRPYITPRGCNRSVRCG